MIPNDLDFKLYVIEDADKMTEQAQNALLLTLEEPPSFVRFILLCQRSELLLETIRSRAPVMRMQGVTLDELDAYLCKTDSRAEQLKSRSPSEYAELLMAADHGIGTALDFLDPQRFAPVKDIRTLALDFCVMAIDGTGAKSALMTIARFSSKRDLLSEQLSCLARALTDLILLKKSENAPVCFFADRDLCVQLCDKVSLRTLYDLNRAVLDAIEANNRNANVRLILIKLLTDAHII
jgi:DNA polymerase-3 subunit delta'